MVGWKWIGVKVLLTFDRLMAILCYNAQTNAPAIGAGLQIHVGDSHDAHTSFCRLCLERVGL